MPVAWTAPMTAVTGNVFTAALFNTHVRDNLLTTEAALATEPMGLLVATGSHTLAYRIPTVEYIGTYETTIGTSYGDLTTFGPSVYAETGTKAIISFGCAAANDTAGLGSRMSYEISGATTLAASDTYSFYAESGNGSDGYQGTWTYINDSLTSGGSLFTAKYRTTAGGGTSSFGHRLMTVISF
jgi:hypothetical protein